MRPVRLRGERAGGPQLPQEEVREGQLRQREPLRVQVRVLRHLRVRLQREGQAQRTQGRDHACVTTAEISHVELALIQV